MKNHSDNTLVVQAWSNVDGWSNTRYGARTMEKAMSLVAELKKSPQCFIGGKVTELRIQPNQGQIFFA